MINISTIPSLSKIRTEPVPDVTKTWKVGQILNATAERNANAQDEVIAFAYILTGKFPKSYSRIPCIQDAP
jgi:hypothetical protein